MVLIFFIFKIVSNKENCQISKNRPNIHFMQNKVMNFFNDIF